MPSSGWRIEEEEEERKTFGARLGWMGPRPGKTEPGHRQRAWGTAGYVSPQGCPLDSLLLPSSSLGPMGTARRSRAILPGLLLQRGTTRWGRDDDVPPCNEKVFKGKEKLSTK